MKVPATPLGAALFLLVVASGCGGVGAGATSSPGPLLGTPAEESSGASVREPDLSPRERWEAPFAVTTAGAIVPIEPRSVIVLAVDSAIAAGMATQQAIEIERPTRNPPPANEPERAPLRGAPGASEAEQVPDGRSGADDVEPPDRRVMPAPSPG